MFKAKDIMKVGVISTMKNSNIYDAVGLMVNNKISGLVVVDDDKHLVGVVTEKDMLKLLMHALDDMEDSSGTVEEYMTPEVTSFDVEDNLIDIGECLMANVFRRVPITDNDKVVGIISRSDVMEYILSRKLKCSHAG